VYPSGQRCEDSLLSEIFTETEKSTWQGWTSLPSQFVLQGHLSATCSGRAIVVKDITGAALNWVVETTLTLQKNSSRQALKGAARHRETKRRFLSK
jgi:hypothetical protein